MNKQELRQALTEARQREGELESMCHDAPPDPSGRWLPKDHLEHMAYFRGRDAHQIDALRAGQEPQTFLNSDEVYQATRDKPAAEVIADAHRSWDAYMAAIEACTDQDLNLTRPDRPGERLINTPGDHLAAHLMWTHLDAGDEFAAEAAVRWAWSLTKRFPVDQRSLSVGAYNVACFYGRTNRADDALPLLRESIEGTPQLKDWAREDPDLDPIRDDPRVAELLQG